MSTRSLTRIWDKDKILVTVYKHYDGYPEGYGLELAKFLDGYKIVNGIPLTHENEKLANGMGCFAAQFIAYFKQEVGDIYIEHHNTSLGEEYIYDVWNTDDGIMMAISQVDEIKKDVYKPKDFILTYGK